MSRLPKRFRRLRWRFAASYMLVTVLSVLTIPILYFAASYLFAIRSPDLPRQMAAALENVTAQTLPYLDRVPVDRSDLQNWLTDFNSNGRVQGAGSAADLWMSGPPYGTSHMAVVDASGQVIAASSPGALPAGTPLIATLTAPQQRVVRAALAGDDRASDLATPEVNGRAEIAVPIKIPGQVIGALVLDMDVAGTQSSFLPRAITSLLGFIVTVTLATGLIGLLFGFLISRGLTRRLRRITLAADAWSRGDFDVSARDPSEDELGQLARDLNRMAEQIQALLATRQELAVVDERNRLARDLHDSVKQQVFAASMQVAAARALVRRDPDAAEAHLADVERMVGDAQRELTALILELRPVALANKGLAPALREYCDEWARRTGITVEVRVRGERSAPLDVEQVLFRVAQEALANVAKHSGATSAEVYLSWEPSALLLSITDNGSGFDAIAADGKGVGLSSMRERIDAVGGALTIGGIARGSGTRIEACVPLVTPPALAAGSATKASDAARA
ncbi:MAG TPA: sensor histidine kinase [Ktedonobacterales bacterium]|nr:sensor histidine kinase [Ktedonobacterales bacterium]